MKKSYLILFVGVLLIGLFLRLFRFSEFVMFLGDQGRDAIVIKRIITLEHLPAIGPTTSIGGVFAGPFFYYLIAPFLLLTNLNPIGLAYSSLFYSLSGLLIAYLIVKKNVNVYVGFIFFVFVVFSSVQIDFSRFSWNPNLLPVFAFITLYFLYKTSKKTSIIWPILMGMFLSFSIQLHYLAGLMFLPLIIIFLEVLARSKNKLGVILKFAIAGVSFAIFSSPLIIFDLKHQFLNTKNFIKVMTNPAVVPHTSSINKFLETNTAFFSSVLKININSLLALFIFISLIIYFVRSRLYKNIFFQIHFLNLFLYIIFFSFINSFRHAHYFGPIYYSLYLITAFFIYQIVKNFKYHYLLTAVFLGLYIWPNSLHYGFLYQRGNNQIGKAKTVAENIVRDSPTSPYQIVAIPTTENIDNVRYFLEVLGKTPLPENSNEQPKELYVLCRFKSCNVLSEGQWQVAAFKNKKVEKSWAADEFIIYKVIHGQ